MWSCADVKCEVLEYGVWSRDAVAVGLGCGRNTGKGKTRGDGLRQLVSGGFKPSSSVCALMCDTDPLSGVYLTLHSIFSHKFCCFGQKPSRRSDFCKNRAWFSFSFFVPGSLSGGRKVRL